MTNGVRVKEATDRANCLNNVLANAIMPCPQDCMIATTLTSITTVQACDVSNTSAWQCRWPTQWVTQQEACNAINLGTDWQGMATVRREYQIQSCGQVVVPTSSPLQLIDVSACSRNRAEPRTVACPDRANASLANELGGPVGTAWRAATSTETGWQGTGVNLTRGLVEGLTLQGQVEVRSRADWTVSSVACERTAERQVFIPCDGTMVDVCDEPIITPSSTIVTTSTVLSGTEIINITQTIVVAGTVSEPSCTTVAAGNTFAGCISDFRPGTLSVNVNQPAVVTGYNQWGYPLMSRPWSYNSTRSIYGTTCRGPISGNFNSGMTVTTMGLLNDLSSTRVISAQPPILLQQNCSQEGMTSGWTTHDYGGGNSGGSGGEGGSGSGCGCDGGQSDSSDCGSL